jgi:hypothetical protein
MDGLLGANDFTRICSHQVREKVFYFQCEYFSTQAIVRDGPSIPPLRYGCPEPIVWLDLTLRYFVLFSVCVQTQLPFLCGKGCTSTREERKELRLHDPLRPLDCLRLPETE